MEGLFLVAPDGREDGVKVQLARPAFSRVLGELKAHRESITRFGLGMKAISRELR